LTRTATSTLDTAHIASLAAGGIVTYTEGQPGGTLLDSTLGVSDSDNLSSATVTVSGWMSGDQLSVGNAGGLTVTDNGNGTLTLSGNAAASVYQTALRSVSFSEASFVDPT